MKEVIIVLMTILAIGCNGCNEREKEEAMSKTSQEIRVNFYRKIHNKRWENGGSKFHRYYISNDLGQELIGGSIEGEMDALIFYRTDGCLVFGTVDSIRYHNGIWSDMSGVSLTAHQEKEAKQHFERASQLLSEQ